MAPGEILGIAAQIAVALAGFAGVVVVFRRESVHEWSPIDKFRLRLLVTNAVLPLALCIIGLLLLSVKPEPLNIWRWCSGVAFVILLPFGIERLNVFRRLDPQQLQSARATRLVFYVSATLGIGATFLQLYNAALLGAFWPFFTGIVVQLIAAMFQFARIILVPPEVRQ
jgi:drug/metabolite transporter (DMT)-like permease